MVLAELRAAAAVHGQLALVHLDAHADIWESYYGARYFHGTVFKRAVEEGLVDASASVQAGMRGTLYGESDIEEPRRLGYDAIYWDELEQLTPEAYGDRVRARIGDRPAFLSFDIDFVDPAFAPATGTPEVGGPSSGQALAYLRALHGIDFRGFDCVEVAPVYDQPANITAWVAASACFEMLSLLAVRRRGRGCYRPMTPTSSRTASAERFSCACSSSVRFSLMISSSPPAPSRQGTPMKMPSSPNSPVR